MGPCILPILLALPGGAFAGTTNSTSAGFLDNFESYTNGTPLINGTNGWYGSSADIIVQSTTFFSGAKAAKIPVDCTLSNKFQTNAPGTNIWLQMDVCAAFHESTNLPIVDTSAAGMFYINSNGNFVVHNGPATDATNSANWVELRTNAAGQPIPPVESNTWVRVKLYQDYAHTNWSLYVNQVLLTNNIGFINPTITNLAGFDLYNGGGTTYLDNVTVMAAPATNPPPDVDAVPKQVTNSVMLGLTPSPVIPTFIVTNSGPAIPYGVEIASRAWLSSFPTGGMLAANSMTEFMLIYSNIPSSWAAGVSNQIVWITTTNWGGTQSVAAVNVTLNIMDLEVTPMYLTNAVWPGDTPTSQTFTVQNAGGGSFTYTTQTGASWIACSSGGGTLGANSSNTLTLNYASTAGWPTGTSNTTVTIASSDGGGASRTVNVTLNVLDAQATMSVSPTALSNMVWAGATPTSRTFEVRNSGGSPLNFTAAKASVCPWIASILPASGTVAANGNQLVTVNYGSTAGWTAGDSSNASIKVASANGNGATQFVSVALSVLNISNVMDVAPASLINGVAVPAAPSNQSFEVRNLSDASFAYTMTTGATWITSVTPGATLAARSTNVVTLTYSATTGWTPGTSNGTVTVTSGGVSKNVDLTLYVYRSGITNTIPFYDDFEQYTNLTPLVSGINGWYGSSTGIVVQQDVRRGGLQAAKIPVDCTLSNPFAPASPTNVWIQMDLLPSLFDGIGFYPTVNTNMAAVFYINSNGNFVVHNGPTTNADNSTNWVVADNVTLPTNAPAWVRINIYEDFANTNWTLYADGALVTNNIGFVNPTLTNFMGFDIYNGAATSYMDNVSVVASTTNSYPPLIVYPPALSQSLFAATVDLNPLVQTVKIVNVWSSDIGFEVSTNRFWVAASPVNGIVTNGTTQDVVLTYANVNGWAAGVSNATVTVVATNGVDYWGTQTVQVVLNLISISNSLYVTPTQFSNSVWRGATPTNRAFEVRNLGDVEFTYTVKTDVFWIASSSNAGTLGAYGMDALTLTNTTDTAAWVAGDTSNATVTVTATNAASGVFAVQTVAVAVNVQDVLSVLAVMPTNLTNAVWIGDTPTNQTFIVSNRSDASFVYSVTNAGAWSWITNCSPTGGLLAAQGASTVTLMYRRTTNWVSSSSSWARVATTAGGGATQDVTVTMNVTNFTALKVAPLYLTNSVWTGDTPTSRTFTVSNTGNLSFVFRVQTSAWWMAASPTSGTLAAQGSSTVTLTYSPTWGWPASQSNATAIVSSTNGCGLTQFVAVVLNVSTPALNYYVATNGGNVFPYTNWAMAASDLTSAVYKANFYTNIGSVVWVSNGLYNLPNQVTISNVTVRSLNGAESVTLNGGSFRGFNLAHTGAALNGLTISNCNAGGRTNGGAVFVSTGLVWNCRLLGNAATNGGGVAVGAGGIVRNCLIWGNTATNGGGVYYDMVGKIGGPSGLVESCTIVSNYARLNGGGLYTSTNMTGLCVNAIVYQNSTGGVAAASGMSSNWGTNINAVMVFSNSCVLPTNGAYGLNNITTNPAFMDFEGGNFRLNTNSPCIDVGTNKIWMTGAVDLDGNQRILHTIVDIGAYENPQLSLTVSPAALTNTVMITRAPANNEFSVSNSGAGTFNYTVFITNDWLLSGSATNGVLAAGEATNIGLVYSNSIASWPVGASNTIVTVVITNSLYPAQTQTVAVTMAVMDLQVASTNLTNEVWIGATPTGQTFEVRNAGAGNFQYETQTGVFWIACSSNAGTLEAYSTNVLTLTYANTAGWGVGTSSTWVKVWSTNGGGATQTVYVTLNVYDLLANMQVTPTNLTNSVMAGRTPTNQSFIVTNTGNGSFSYTVTNTAWLAGTSTNGILGPNSGAIIAVIYDPTTGWTPAASNGVITVTSSDGGGVTQYVAVVLNVMDLQAAPAGLTNSVMVGWTPTNRTFSITNAGIGSYNYTVSVTNNWLSCTPTNGTLGSLTNAGITVMYSNTAGWALGASNTTILIASADGGGATQAVDVVLTILGRTTNFYVSRDGLSIAPYTNWTMAATNMQDAVNAAISGDHVWVSNGVFTLTSQVGVTNGIIIEAVYGRANTFVNGNYPVTTNRCFYVAHSNAIVQGFTISNGCYAFGGGVCLAEGATLRDCVISGNRATATVTDGGGGIFADSLSIVTNCVIAGNTSAGLAGGLLLDNGSKAFNCPISNNTAIYEGGGVVIRSDSEIWNSTIAGNRASAVGAQGGGVMLGETAADVSTMWNCTLVNNSADIGGGLAAASGRARNCLIYQNSAGIAGAGVYMAESSDSTIQNCTISSNIPFSYGVYAYTNAGGYFENSIIVSNAIALNSANVAFTNNCVESTNGLSGSGNITNNPAFVNFAGGNYRLSAVSPCNNAGTNQAWMAGATDLDGNPRIIGPSVDMGAYENPVSWTVSPGTLTNQVMAGRQPTNQGFAIVNNGSNTLYYAVTTNAPWVMANSNSGTLGAYETNALAISYGVTTDWTPGRSNAAVIVVVTNNVSALYPPQTQNIAVVMNVMQMQTAPASLTNNVMKDLPSSNTFNVANLGQGVLSYTISTNGYGWVSVEPAGGVLTNASTNTITVTYAATLPYGVTTGLLTVASSSGGGATQYVALTVNVMDLQTVPGGLTNVVLAGYTPTNQSFSLVNHGTAPLTYTLATNATWVFCSDPGGGTLTGPGTNTIAVTYEPTTGWTPGTSNAIVTIVSTNGGGMTQTVTIVMNVTELLPPSGVTASKGTYADKVRVTWNVVTNALGYQVWRNTANITATATNLGAVADTLYDDTTALQDVTYYYWVKSTNSLGVGGFSAPDTGCRSLGAPPAPTGLTASKGIYSDKVALSWTASPGAIGYEVWRSASSDSNTAAKVSSPDPTLTSYADTSATNGVVYYFWVKAKGSNDTVSAFSASDTGWRSIASPSVNASKGLRREVSVTWSASAGVTHYELWKNLVDESSSAALLTDGAATSYRDLAVTPGSRYYYWVKAFSALGDSGMGTSSVGWCGAAKWDFNGDGRAEVWYYHEESGRWYVMMTTNTLNTFILGGAGWTAVPADYDGDGITDFAVYNRGESSTGSGLGGTWKFMFSGSGYEVVTASTLGGAGYAAAVEDYDGDGKADPAIYAEASGTWQILMSGSGYQTTGGSGFGEPGYDAVTADYDGDGKADLAIQQQALGSWFMLLSGNNYQSTNIQFGLSGYVPVPGYYDGRIYAQLALYDTASGYWYILTGPGECRVVDFGLPGYTPMPADYDGDRYEDEGVFYRSTQDAIWYLWKSTEGFQMISGRNSRP